MKLGKSGSGDGEGGGCHGSVGFRWSCNQTKEKKIGGEGMMGIRFAFFMVFSATRIESFHLSLLVAWQGLFHF